MKKLNKIDITFVMALLPVLAIHLFFLFLVPALADEGFYASIPFRLVNGDSLIRHEWHLSQFSSLFSFLPVWIWTSIKGSAEGIIFFLRCVYLIIHTTIAVGIYGFFRKYKVWAIIAALMFYIHIPYRIQAISYHSAFIIFLLLLCFCLISIYEKKSARYYILGGICYGCCCVCNPLLCIGFALYIVTYILWSKRPEFLLKFKIRQLEKQTKNLTNREKKKQKKQVEGINVPQSKYDCFFEKSAIKGFCIGLLIIAVMAILFFLLTGGTISSAFRNIGNLLGNSNYQIASLDIFSKIFDTVKYLTKYSFGMVWLLPVLFTIMHFDKKKFSNQHRFTYLLITIIWSIVFVIGCLVDEDFIIFPTAFPFALISVACYVLTENKNKVSFNCMYIPCLIATLFQWLAANTHLPVISMVLSVSNIAGVLFAMDLWKEMSCAKTEDTKTDDGKGFLRLCRGAIVIGICIQIVFYGIAYQHKQLPGKDSVQAEKGPYAGLYMSQEDYDDYNMKISDLDAIREITREDDPVYLVTISNWMHLYLDRSIAVNTVWYTGYIDTEQMIKYYKENPKKIPKYIYITAADPKTVRLQGADELFVFTQEELSNGVLLTVEGKKF